MKYVIYSVDGVSAMDLMKSQAKVMTDGLSKEATVSIFLTKSVADNLEFSSLTFNEATLQAWVIGSTAPDWNDEGQEPCAKIDLLVSEVIADDAAIKQEFAYLTPNLALEVLYRPLSEDGLVKIKDCCPDEPVLLGQASDDTCQQGAYQLEIALEDENGIVYTESLVSAAKSPNSSCSDDVSVGVVKRPYMF